MGRIALPLALALVALLGASIRLLPIAERVLPPAVRDLGASRWFVDDPGTALHLRRIQLTLAEGRAPQHDTFLAHPEAVEIPALPVFDALIAGASERWLAWELGDPSTAGVDESDLEALAARVGPILGLFGLLAVAWAAWTASSGASIAGSGAGLATLAALALVALAPATVRATEIGRLDAAALAIVLLALLVRSTQVATRANDALSTILESLLAGVVAGLLASVSAAGAFLALPTAAALFLRARSGPPEVRAIAVRAGLLFALVAAFVARLPLADGPWETLPDGLVARWTLATSDLLLLAAAPFAFLLLTALRDPARGKRTFARLAAMAAMLLLLVFEAPRAVRAAAGPIEAWWTARGLLEQIDSADIPWWGSAFAVTGLAIFALFLACRRAWRTREPASIHLAALTGVAGLATLADTEFAPLFVVSAACALAGVLAAKPSRWVVIAGALLLVPHAVVPFLTRPTAAEREQRIALVQGLRWIRENIAAGGPFNSSSARGDWGVLVDPRWGELVAYHARRPAFASRSAAFSQPEAVREALRLTREAPAEDLVARMNALGLRLAFGSGLSADPTSPSGAIELALWKSPDPAQPDVPGLTRAFTSDTFRGLDGSAPFAPGRAAAPVAVVWQLEGTFAPRTPTMRAPR